MSGAFGLRFFRQASPTRTDCRRSSDRGEEGKNPGGLGRAFERDTATAKGFRAGCGAAGGEPKVAVIGAGGFAQKLRWHPGKAFGPEPDATGSQGPEHSEPPFGDGSRRRQGGFRPNAKTASEHLAPSFCASLPFWAPFGRHTTHPQMRDGARTPLSRTPPSTSGLANRVYAPVCLCYRGRTRRSTRYGGG